MCACLDSKTAKIVPAAKQRKLNVLSACNRGVNEDSLAANLGPLKCCTTLTVNKVLYEDPCRPVFKNCIVTTKVVFKVFISKVLRVLM